VIDDADILVAAMHMKAPGDTVSLTLHPAIRVMLGTEQSQQS
jgi:hypothetical protein